MLRSWPDGCELPASPFGFFENVLAPLCLEKYPKVSEILVTTSFIPQYVAECSLPPHCVTRSSLPPCQILATLRDPLYHLIESSLRHEMLVTTSLHYEILGTLMYPLLHHWCICERIWRSAASGCPSSSNPSHLCRCARRLYPRLRIPESVVTLAYAILLIPALACTKRLSHICTSLFAGTPQHGIFPTLLNAQKSVIINLPYLWMVSPTLLYCHVSVHFALLPCISALCSLANSQCVAGSRLCSPSSVVCL